MKNNVLILSTLVAGLVAAGSATAAPNEANVNRGNITPADVAQRAAPNTLTQKIEDERGELKATQPGAVEVSTAKGLPSQDRVQQEARARATRIQSDAQANVQAQANRAQDALNQGQMKAEAYQSNVNRGQVTPADMRSEAARITLQQRIEDARGELKATQPGRVEISQGNASVAQGNAQQSNRANNQPLLKGESRGTANAGEQTAPITLQQKIKDNRGELLATQPGEVEFQESRHIREL